MALGAVFSALEVIPLTFLTVEAWTFLQLGARQESRTKAPFPHRWAVMFLVAVGFWNFLGAGVFGFLVNLPIVSYYQIGTSLTANHAHGSMMGVYGMLAVGLTLFALRYVIPRQKWPERLAKLSFWSLNIGLAWMMFATLLPLGVLQLWASVNEGYFEAPRWATYAARERGAGVNGRLPGDVVFPGRRGSPLRLYHLVGGPLRGEGHRHPYGLPRPSSSRSIQKPARTGPGTPKRPSPPPRPRPGHDPLPSVRLGPPSG